MEERTDPLPRAKKEPFRVLGFFLSRIFLFCDTVKTPNRPRLTATGGTRVGNGGKTENRRTRRKPRRDREPGISTGNRDRESRPGIETETGNRRPVSASPRPSPGYRHDPLPPPPRQRLSRSRLCAIAPSAWPRPSALPLVDACLGAWPGLRALHRRGGHDGAEGMQMKNGGGRRVCK